MVAQCFVQDYDLNVMENNWKENTNYDAFIS